MLGSSSPLYPGEFLPADHTYIQYFGRWDMSDPAHPKHAWPGTYVLLKFTGTSLGVKMDDNLNYYNIYIDGGFAGILKGNQEGDVEYVLARGLEEGEHTLRFSKRNFSFDRVHTFSGVILADGARLLPPPPTPTRRIEFLGDSFTSAEGNEARRKQMLWIEKMPVTNIDKGFAVIAARHFDADYHITSRSGIGLVCDWQGKFDMNLPGRFDRTFLDSPEPKCDFRKWIPALVVVCLGLNDHSGLKGADGEVSGEKSAQFRDKYHKFIATLRKVYPGVKILAVAAHTEWIQENVVQVVDEEKTMGFKDVVYAHFDRYPGGYVATGHPNVETHRKIAGVLIKAIEEMAPFSK